MRHVADANEAKIAGEWMSLGRIVLLLLAVAVGAGTILLVEGNTTLVTLHLGSFAGRAEAPLWLVVASAFLGGAVTAGLLVGLVWLTGPFFKVLVGIFFVFVLCVAAAVMGMRGAAGIALLVGLLLLLAAVTWERRGDLATAATGVRTGAGTSWRAIWAALGAIHSELTEWAQGLMSIPSAVGAPPTAAPPLVAPPPPSVIALLIVLLLATALLGSTMLLRAALVLAFAAAGIVAALRAMTLVRVGTPIEMRARYGGLGGGRGGWRLSQPASLLLIAAILLAAAVGLAPVERGPELRRPADAKPAAEPAPKKAEQEKAPEPAKPASPPPQQH